MRLAFAIKAVAAAVVALAWWQLGAPWNVVVTALVVTATVALFVWAIVSPRAQLLVPTAFRLDGPGIAFTFDDGPDPTFTPKILEVLARHQVRATFFVVGQRAAAHPELVRRIEAEGHVLGSHTQTHSHAFHFGSPSRMHRDIEAGLVTLEGIVGHRPVWFRPPQGLRTPMLRDALTALPSLVCVTWTERGLDAMGRSAEQIVARLSPRLQPGAILTLHDGVGFGGTTDRSPTVEALDTLLTTARRRGLSFVTVDSLVPQKTASGIEGAGPIT